MSEPVNALVGLDPEKSTLLLNDTSVTVVDILNIGESKERQLSRLIQKSKPESSRTVNEVDTEEDAGNIEFRPQTTIKYTVKDSVGTLAYLLPATPFKQELRLGANIIVSKGTSIWRSILVPKPNQVRRVDEGIVLTTDQQIARLRTETF